MFQLAPALSLLGLLASIYSLYLFYLGIPELMQAPREKAGMYTLAVVVSAIVVALVIGLVASVFQPGAPSLAVFHS